MDALARIMGLVDRTIDQVASGQPVDVALLNRQLTWETVRAGVESVVESEQRSNEADAGITATR